MLIGKNLTNKVSCFSKICRWIVTEEVGRTSEVVPAKFHFEERRARKLRQSFSPDLARPLDPLLGELHELFVPTKIVVILFKSGRVLLPRLPILCLLQRAVFAGHGAHDHSDYLVLEGPRIHSRPIKALSPNMLTGLRINELSDDAKLVAILAYAAFDHVADAQVFSDLSNVDSLALVSEGGTAGDHH